MLICYCKVLKRKVANDLDLTKIVKAATINLHYLFTFLHNVETDLKMN